MAVALQQHAYYDIKTASETPHGVKYFVEGTLQTQVKRHPLIRSVWIIEAGDSSPRLVTAYPP